jgi:hypothetical protein
VDVRSNRLVRGEALDSCDLEMIVCPAHALEPTRAEASRFQGAVRDEIISEHDPEEVDISERAVGELDVGEVGVAEGAADKG